MFLLQLLLTAKKRNAMSNSQDEQLDKFIADLWVAITRFMKITPNPGGLLTEEYDLTPQQIFTLWQLQEHGQMTMGELAEMLSVTHGVATRMVDRLLKKKMVERNRDENDRRVVRISLTKQGTDVAAEAVEGAISFARDVFRGVSQRDREGYLTLLARIEEAQSNGSDE